MAEQAHLYAEYQSHEIAGQFQSQKIQYLIDTSPMLKTLKLQGNSVDKAIQTVLERKMADWDAQNINQGYGSIKMRANWDLRFNGNTFEWKIGVLKPGQQPQEWQKMYAVQQQGQSIPDSIGVSFSWEEVQQEMNILAQNQEPKTQEVQYVSNLIDRQLTGFLMQNPDLIPFQQDILAQMAKDAETLIHDGLLSTVGQVQLTKSNMDNAVCLVLRDITGKTQSIDVPLPDAQNLVKLRENNRNMGNRLASLRSVIDGRKM